MSKIDIHTSSNSLFTIQVAQNAYTIIKFDTVEIKYRTFNEEVESIKHCIEVVNKFKKEFKIE